MDLRHELATQLAGWAAGERFWFWFCPQLAEQHDRTPLVVTSLRADPTMKVLRAHSRTLSAPASAPVRIGLANMSENGRVELGAERLSAAERAPLARWVGRHAFAEPELARLRDTTFVELGADRSILGRYQRPELWRGLPAPPEPEELPAWCWFGDRVVRQPQHQDPSGAAFASRIRSGGVHGVLRRSAGGEVLFVTTSPARAAAAQIAAIAPEHAGMQVITVGGGQPRATARVPVADPFAEMEPGQRWWFSFEGAGPLRLSLDRGTLPSIQGRARLTERGRLELVVRTAPGSLLDDIARWAGEQMRPTRLTWKRRDGVVRARQIWSPNNEE